MVSGISFDGRSAIHRKNVCTMQVTPFRGLAYFGALDSMLRYKDAIATTLISFKAKNMLAHNLLSASGELRILIHKGRFHSDKDNKLHMRYKNIHIF